LYDVFGIGNRTVSNGWKKFQCLPVAVIGVPTKILMYRCRAEQIRYPPLPDLKAKPNVTMHNADEHQPLNPLSERDQINAERYNSSQRAAELWNNEIVPRI
jgi:hypothetical protein